MRGMAVSNSILIVEFTHRLQDDGMSVVDAVVSSCRIRLRPILMTSFAFIMGCVPLWLASGSGAMSRRTLGTVVIGGMLGATLVDTFIVPVTFAVVEKLRARFSRKHANQQSPQAPEPNG